MSEQEATPNTIEWPPGLKYFYDHSSAILIPPALVHIAKVVGARVFNVIIPLRYLIAAYILAGPVILAFNVLVRDWNISLAAAAHGAELPFNLSDPTPGSLVTVYRTGERFRTAYPGDLIFPALEKHNWTVNLRMFFTNRIITCEPEHIKIILATQFEDFEKGPDLTYPLHSLLGTGVFAADGDLWKFHRTMTRPFFSKDRVSHFEIFDRHAEKSLEILKSRVAQDIAVDVQDLTGRFTMDSATEFLFGKDLRSLSGKIPYPHNVPAPNNTTTTANEAIADARFFTAFNAAQLQSAYRIRFGYQWPLFELWKDTVEDHMKIVRETLAPILDAAIEKKKLSEVGMSEEQKKAAREESATESETVLDHLLQFTQDPVTLRDEIMNLAVAGRDTTSALLTHSIYMLAEHPEVLKKLRAEILEKIGPTRRPTFDDFRDMKYLRAFINEVLRLYPPVPFNMRSAKKDVVFPSRAPGTKPVFVPAGTRVVYSVFFMHRRKDLWGPDVEKFDPDRFLDQRVRQYLTPNPFIFLPFNAGPRICLGQQFAYHESSFFLVRLLQQFSSIWLDLDAQPPEGKPNPDWQLDPDAGERKLKEKVWPASHLTAFIKGGLWVKMSIADK